jgi:hypothetical protein
LRLARGEGADILLYVKNLQSVAGEVIIFALLPSDINLFNQDDFDFMGICVEAASTVDGVKKCSKSLSKFAYYMSSSIFKGNGAKYFSLGGSNRTKKSMETLPFPCDYLTGFISNKL